MKSFIFNPLNVDPHDVARHDYLEFFVGKFYHIEVICDFVAPLNFMSSGLAMMRAATP